MLSRHAVSVRSAHKAASSAAAHSVENVTKVSSGLTVATLDNHGPLSQLVLAFRAGSRYETAAQAGLVHTLRNFVGRDTTQYPGTSVVWSSAAAGGVLKSFATRDIFGVSMTVPRDETAHALSILGHAASQPAFKPWEVEDVLPTMRADNGYRTPFDYVFEGIHRAAYRNGPLANSVYSPCSQIGKISTQTLSKFADDHLVSGNGIIFGTNIEQEQLILYAENYSPIRQGNAVSTPSSPYKVFKQSK
ncbi:unnamed protein product [Caenorhabditis bovis]|uniref:Peptidase M16 N-terminal domain-containing protein n=1 Tax=Caenorhabditis bovis TaxID=2654633 RepID=A0A8S1FFD8_9PELO|nr:unnamed protein product [Caenorhabditis bovis]